VRRRIIAVSVLALVVTVLAMCAWGALVGTFTVSNRGTIGVRSSSSALGIYSDSGCASALSSISWGTMGPGDVSIATMYIRNEVSSAVTLSMTENNWDPPSASDYFTLGWNLDGYVLQPNQVLQALLTLNVSSSVSGITNFSFDILITAAQ
jgi:hypothetical protein